MKDLIQKTIAKLKKEKIKPFPRWRFVLMDTAYWLLIGLAILFSAVALAAGMYLFFQIDWEVSRYVPGGTLKVFFLYTPYVWFAVLVVLMSAVFYFIRKTKEGYKYKWVVILLSFLVLVMTMGIGAHFVRIGEIADNFAYRRVPFYRNLAPGMEHMWLMTEDGFLAGRINSVKGNKIRIIDLNGKEWEIIISEKTIKRGPFEIEKGGWVKIFGKLRNGNVFDAQVIMTGGGRRMRGEGGMMRGSGRGWE